MPPGTEDRRLAAIMFTDTVGFTGLGQRNEGLMMELLNEQRRLVRPFFEKNRGREVKTTGDGFLVEFSSALDAVRCALDIQGALKEENSKRTEEKSIIVRIGIHLGDVIHTGDDVAGDAVNVASRVEPIAPPGGICVTSQVYASVVNKVECQFESLGTPALKNVATPVEVYGIVGYGAQMTRPPPARGLPKDRVAVLPFVNISPDPADEYFADGITEEMISSLSRTKGLRVIARASVIKYRATAKSVSDIGRELNVGSVLEGSVRKAGDTIRITAQLVETSNEETVWSQDYDRKIEDVFAIQIEVAQRVTVAYTQQKLVVRPPAQVASTRIT